MLYYHLEQDKFYFQLNYRIHYIVYYGLIHGIVSKKRPSFSDFSVNSRAQIPKRAHRKQANTTYNIFARINSWSQLRLLSFTLYLYFTSSLFLPTTLFAPTSATAGVLRPPDQVGIRNSNTASPPTSDEALAFTEPLHQPPHLWRCICCRACRRLWLRPPFSPTLDIHCCHRRQWWPPITAYLMPPLLIYSKLSVPIPVSMRDASPSSLKPNSYRPPYLCVVKQDENEYLEGELEENVTESDWEIRLGLNLESDSDSLPPYSSLS